MAERTCETCRFVFNAAQGTICRRFPPRPVMTGTHSERKITVWPVLDRSWSDWCGEHQPREVGDE